MERHHADTSLDPRILDAYGSRDLWRIDNYLHFLGYSPTSRAKLTKMRGDDHLLTLVDADGMMDVAVLFRAGELPRADFVLNATSDPHSVTLTRIIPAWFKGTLVEAAHKDGRVLFNPAATTTTDRDLWLPNRMPRNGRPAGGRNDLSPIVFPCTSCNAEPGFRCTSENNVELTSFHAPRQNAAEALPDDTREALAPLIAQLRAIRAAGGDATTALAGIRQIIGS